MIQFTMDYMKGNVISRNKDILRKVSMGACIYDDDVYVVVGVESELDVEKKVCELRALLN